MLKTEKAFCNSCGNIFPRGEYQWYEGGTYCRKCLPKMKQKSCLADLPKDRRGAKNE